MSVLLLGGDVRQKYACEYLAEWGCDARAFTSFTLDENMRACIRDATAIVLPLPCTNDGVYINMPFLEEKIKIRDIAESAGAECLLLGGKIPSALRSELDALGKRYVDYYEIETFQIQNALLSAEGAIYYAKQSIDSSFWGARVGILGFGRIGKMLAYLLRSMGARVSVCARRESDISWSRMLGMEAFCIGGEKYFSHIGKQDIIFNTVPYNIITDSVASVILPRTLIIDLASAPYGIGEDVLKKYSLNYRRELGIPGRYAPRSAGEILAQAVSSMLSRED